MTKTFSLYKIDSKVVTLFNPLSLMSVVTLYNLPTGKFIMTNIKTGGDLFNGLTAVESNGGHVLTSGHVLADAEGNNVAFVKSSSGKGSKFIFYNAPDPNEATMIHLLVTGDPNHDYYSGNISVSVEKVGDNYLIKNESKLNNLSYQTVKLNKMIKARNKVRWVLSKVDGGVAYIASSSLGYSQLGGCRPDYVKLTTKGGTVISTDKTGNSQINDTSADYIIKASDLADIDVEELSLTHVRFAKNETTPLRIPVAQILDIQ